MIMRDTQAIRFWTAFVVLAMLNLAGWAWLRSSNLEQLGQPLVRLDSHGGADRFGENGRVPLTFDRSSMPRIGSDLQFLRIEPATSGRWRVRSANQLAFETLEPPRPGMVYKVVPDHDHPFFARYEMDVERLEPIRFRPLALDASRLVDVDERRLAPDSGDRRFELELVFNQEVAPDDLMEALAVTVDLEPVSCELITRETAATHRMSGFARSGATIRCRIASDLSGADGTLSIGEDVQRDHRMSEGLRAGRIWSYMPSFGRGVLQLPMNSRLQPGQDLSGVTVTPAVANLDVRARSYQLVITGDFRPETRYTVTVPPPLVASNGTALTETLRLQCTTDRRESRIRFRHGDGVLGERGTLELELEHVNVRRAVATVHRLPERNVPLYLGGLDSPADLKRLGEPIAERQLALDPLGGSEPTMSVLELEELVERRPGIYLVHVGRDLLLEPTVEAVATGDRPDPPARSDRTPRMGHVPLRG